MTSPTETRPAETSVAPTRLGPFEILGRLAGEKGSEVVTLSVKGTAPSTLAGREGLALCFSAPADEAGRARLRSLLTNLVALDHPAIDGPVHADVRGSFAYVVEAPLSRPPGASPAAPGRLSPSQVAEYLLPITAALETAHRAGFSHGSLSPTSVTIGDDGPVIGEWTVFGRGPAADQHGLALLIVEWLAGAPFHERPATTEAEPGDQRRERLRRHLDDVTERLVRVLARASEASPTDRYASVTDFVAAYQEAVTRSGEDLVQGAFEAISARTPELAHFLMTSAERYDPDAPNLALLKLQLGIVSYPLAGIGDGAAPSNPMTARSPEAPVVMTALDPVLTDGIPPEMMALIAPPIRAPAKPRLNPWVVMIVGVVGLTLLLLLAAMVVLFAGMP